jgi:hypothetical protein
LRSAISGVKLSRTSRGRIAVPQDVTTKDPKRKVYLNYTAEELDWQYDHSKRFADTSAFNRERAAKSAEVRQKIKGRLDVPYGPGKSAVLDIYPAAQKDAPIGVFIWRRLDPRRQERLQLPGGSLRAARCDLDRDRV